MKLRACEVRLLIGPSCRGSLLYRFLLCPHNLMNKGGILRLRLCAPFIIARDILDHSKEMLLYEAEVGGVSKSA